jgi:hypothetical protein
MGGEGACKIGIAHSCASLFAFFEAFLKRNSFAFLGDKTSPAPDDGTPVESIESEEVWQEREAGS